MADFTASSGGADAEAESGFRAGAVVNVTAAAVSIALIGGVGIWGYKLLVRDVTGVPVVRALSGEMRVSPTTPGGEIAAHVGLSVNSVPGEGGAAQPEDRLILAPSASTLQADDFKVKPREGSTAEASEVNAAPDGAVASNSGAARVDTTLTRDDIADGDRLNARATPVEPTAALTAQDVLALADQIAAGSTPMTELSEGETAPAEIAVNGVRVDPNVIPDAVPGVRRSLRPNLRPSVRAVVTPGSASPQIQAPATDETPSGEITNATIPAGTKLVQLGAFDSADIAATQWASLTGQFPDFFSDKDRVIQEVTTGGRTFFRLRALGFSDLNDARRFCSVMSAQGTACIPVVAR